MGEKCEKTGEKELHSFSWSFSQFSPENGFFFTNLSKKSGFYAIFFSWKNYFINSSLKFGR